MSLRGVHAYLFSDVINSLCIGQQDFNYFALQSDKLGKLGYFSPVTGAIPEAVAMLGS